MESYQAAKEEIKRAADIVEVVGQFVQLKKAGQNFAGLCPFHSEKDPSFTVSSSKQMFHCFGCKKGGDVFAFWMEYHKVSFPQAMQDLAEKFHITLPEKRLSAVEKGRKALKDSLIELNEVASSYFHNILNKSPKGITGREYFKRRLLSKETISEYRLGYALDEWSGLTDYLKTNKENLEKAVQAGLVIPRKNGGYYDRFRGRVVFPIINLRKQVVGFGARVMDDSLPKYINSPESPIFHKGSLLYGLQLAYPHIRESGRAVIVEGYTDVLSLGNQGFYGVVATLGTALTRDHIRILKGYTKEAVIVFDPDSAGKTAAMRSLPFFLDEGLTAKVVLLPEDEDPDSFVNSKCLDAFTNLLDQAVPMFDFFVDSKISQGGNLIEDQVSILKDIIPMLSELKNAAQCALYVNRLSEKLGVAESALMTELEKWQRHKSMQGNEKQFRSMLAASKATINDDLPLLNLLIHYPDTIEQMANHDFRALFNDPITLEIFDALTETHRRGERINPSEMMDRLDKDPAKEQLREILVMPPICGDEEVQQAVSEFETKAQRIKMSRLSSEARKQGDIESLNRLLELKRQRETE